MRFAVSIAIIVAALASFSAPAQARRETYGSCTQTSGGPGAVTGANNVGAAQINGSSILVDYYDGETSAERSAVSGILTGAPYSCASPTADTTVFATPWMPLDEAGVEYWLTPHILHCTQEDGSDTTQTSRTACAVSSGVGQVNDPSVNPNNGHVTVSLSSASRPTLATDGSPDVHFHFVAASSQRISVLASAGASGANGAFSFLHSTGVGTIAIRVRSNTNGVTQTLLDSINGTGANTGINLQKNTSNQLVFTAAKTSNVFSKTTTGTLLAADGVQWVIITLNGNSSNIQIQPKNVSETFSLANPVGGTNDSNDLVIGCRASSGAACADMDIWDVVIANTTWTSAQVTRAKNAPLPRSTVTQPLLRLASRCFTNFVRRCYLADQISTLWTNTGRTTQVSADGNSIAAWDNFHDTTDHLNRGMRQASASLMPVYRDGSGTSLHPAAEFNGTTSPNNSNMSWNGTDQTGGDQTMLSLHWNRDLTNGSHFSQGSAYCAATGRDYSGNPTGPGDGGAYQLCHPSSGNSTHGCGLFDPTHWNLYELYKVGAAYEERCSRANDTGSVVIGNTTMFRMANIGNNNNANFEMDGYKGLHVLWLMNLGTARIDNIVMPYIRTHYSQVSLAP